MFVDMCGKRFGRFTVISRAENDKHGNAMWLCKCDCGTLKTVAGTSLRKGVTLSCGCYHRDKVAEIGTTHGGTHTRLYSIWQKMKRRCYNPNHKFYSYYGGRGITVCEEWKDDFSAFREWAENNGYADSLTIDRIDTNGNYEPSNCRWITRKEQQNNIRSNHVFTINGETKTLAQWCEIYNVPHERTRNRVVNLGWEIVDALTTPPLKKNGRTR